MKILQVRFANLNSLVGEWSIDFTDPLFSSNGIYAITGNTGSGKSTILDAISLAIYGRTPRLRQISKTSNEIMSRQTGYCFSEITFISAKGHFRCHWAQHRARKAAEGDLQAPRHEFVDADKDRILATKIKDVASQVLKATGMNFDQFTRSMLLAQGEFSKFLHANPDERAPILEQITGTEIFSEISQHVHYRFSAEKDLLATLQLEVNLNKIMTAEEEHQCTEELHKNLAEAALSQKNIEQTSKLLNWRNSMEKLKDSIKDLQLQEQQLNKEWDELGTEREKLRKAETGERLHGHYAQLQQSRAEQKAELETLESTAKQLEIAKPELERGARQLEIIETELKEAAQYKQSLDEIIKQVRKLDLLLAAATKEQKKYNKEISRIHQHKATLSAALREHEISRQTSGKELAELQDYLKHHAQHGALIDAFSGIKEQTARLAREKVVIENLAAKITKLDQAQETISRNFHEKETAIQKVTTLYLGIQEQLKEVERQEKNLKITDVANLYEALQQTKSSLVVLKEQAEAGKKLAALKEEEYLAESHKNKLAQESGELGEQISEKLQLITLIKTRATKQEEVVLLANKIESFAKEREKLQNDHPCPLCGSREHPYSQQQEITKSAEEQRLQVVRTQLEDEEKKLKKLEMTQAVWTTELEQLSETQKTRKSLITKLESQQQHFMETQEFPIGGLTLGPLEITIERVESDIIKQQADIEKANTLLKTRQKLEKESSSLTAELATAKQTHLTATHELATLKEKSQQLSEEKSEKIFEREQAINKLRALGEQYNLDTQLSSNPEKILSQLERLRDQWRDSQARLNTLEKAILNIDTQRQLDSASLARATEELQSAKMALTTLNEEKGKLSEQRKALFGDEDPDLAEQKAAEKITELDQKRRAAQNVHLAANQKVTTYSERMSQLLLSTDNRKQKLLQLEQEFSRKLSLLAFNSEEAFTSALLSPEDLETLKTRVEGLNQRRVEIQNQKKISENELNREQTKNLSLLTKDELNAELVKENSQLNELQQRIGLLKGKLGEQKTAKQLQCEKLLKIQSQEKELEYWGQLHTLIGSADGKKFRNFAQGLTFELMISSANISLRRMTDRYLLIRDNTHPLRLNVIDNYQAGEIRSTANLSGGESFIISLALALGLSSMASKRVQVDSLFLDEGFGSLDEDSLELALEALNRLQQQGKTIGIISHVPLLKERISVQLQLTTGLNGRSTIVGPGVARRQGSA